MGLRGTSWTNVLQKETFEFRCSKMWFPRRMGKVYCATPTSKKVRRSNRQESKPSNRKKKTKKHWTKGISRDRKTLVSPYKSSVDHEITESFPILSTSINSGRNLKTSAKRYQDCFFFLKIVLTACPMTGERTLQMSLVSHY